MYEYMCRTHKNEEEMHTLTHHSIIFCLYTEKFVLYSEVRTNHSEMEGSVV